MNTLINIDELFDTTWKNYKKDMGYYALLELAIMGVNIGILSIFLVVIGIVVYKPFTALFLNNGIQNGELTGAHIALFAFAFLILTAAIFLIGSWSAAVSWLATTSSQKPQISKALSEGFKLVPRYLGLHLIRGIAIFIGYLFFIVPGILFSVWFAFDTIFAQKKSIMDSLRSSRSFVIGQWWLVMLRLFLAYIIVVLIPQFLSSIIQSIFLEKGSNIVAYILAIMIFIAIVIARAFFFYPWYRMFKLTLVENKHASTIAENHEVQPAE